MEVILAIALIVLAVKLLRDHTGTKKNKKEDKED